MYTHIQTYIPNIHTYTENGSIIYETKNESAWCWQISPMAEALIDKRLLQDITL